VGNHDVVWWDPAALPAGREAQFGVRQEDLLADEPQAEEAGVAAHQQWQKRRTELIEKGLVPAVELVLASETQEPPSDWDGEVRIESTVQFSERPAGKRFGALIHAILRDVALDARRAEIEALARLQGKILASDREEVDAAAVAVEAALHHPLMERARKAPRCHREYPVSLRLDGRRMLEGVIDLAFLENTRWVVVDFKTDATVEQYRPQVAWYAFALTRITGWPADAYLLRV
jgi:ATP-dependent exoDNAse (exonuclease V) beta subunit